MILGGRIHRECSWNVRLNFLGTRYHARIIEQTTGISLRHSIGSEPVIRDERRWPLVFQFHLRSLNCRREEEDRFNAVGRTLVRFFFL